MWRHSAGTLRPQTDTVNRNPGAPPRPWFYIVTISTQFDGVKIDRSVLIFVNTHFGEKAFSCCTSFMMYKSLFRASKRRMFIELFKEQSELSDIHAYSREISCHIRSFVVRTWNPTQNHEFTWVAKSTLMFDCCYRSSFFLLIWVISPSFQAFALKWTRFC